jgi:hypothetical protein
MAQYSAAHGHTKQLPLLAFLPGEAWIASLRTAFGSMIPLMTRCWMS